MEGFDWNSLLNNYYQQASPAMGQSSDIMGVGNLDTSLAQGGLTPSAPNSPISQPDVSQPNAGKGDNPWGIAALTIGKSLISLLGKGGGGGNRGFAPSPNVGNAYPFNMPKDIYPQKDAFKALLARYLQGGG